jgi:hypothetical protein
MLPHQPKGVATPFSDNSSLIDGIGMAIHTGTTLSEDIERHSPAMIVWWWPLGAARRSWTFSRMDGEE